jgi:6-phosphogluconate dehydrogenase
MTQQQFGIIGLGVMGQNLALNVARNGVHVVGYDRSATARDKFAADAAAGKRIRVVASMGDFMNALTRPRHILLMIPAGAPVDAAIQELRPWLQPGDLIVDGGNSFFEDTERRLRALAAEGFHFVGLGVSGGADGALWGPSLMVGGDEAAYRAIEPILVAVAARAHDGEPCAAYLGPGGAGHYVKMVHNGIEYGDMQLVAEAYDLMRRGAGVDYETLAEIFTEWNKGELASYLIEITADIFRQTEAETKRPLLDIILDKASQKGTGKWTSQNGLDVGAAIPTLTAAVHSRLLSSQKEERLRAAELFTGPKAMYQGERGTLVNAVRAALYASKICAYAQGMSLLRAASNKYGYDLDLAVIARIWRGGCIIRADLLDDIARVFTQDAALPNLLLDPEISRTIAARQDAWRYVAATAVSLGIPMPATTASLSYFDGYRSARLPANLIQAQRDYFGAHTFERTDRPGLFRHDWHKSGSTG